MAKPVPCNTVGGCGQEAGGGAAIKQPWLGTVSGAGQRFCSFLAGRLYSLGVFRCTSPSFTRVGEHLNVFFLRGDKG